MDVPSSTAVTENNDDSADDVFTPPSAEPVSTPQSAEPTTWQERTTSSPLLGATHQGEDEEELLPGGSPYLPSHPEPLLPEEEPKVPATPISLNDENYHRGNWGNKLEYLAVMVCQLTTISMFSFSYFCYRNGGLIFVVPYILILFFFGMPTILLAISIGQFTSSGFCTLWKFCPIVKGLWGFILLQTVGTMVATNTLLSRSFTFLSEALVHPRDMPWVDCSNHWNTENCQDHNTVQNLSDMDYYASYYYSPRELPVPHERTTPAKEYIDYMYGGGRIPTMAVIGSVLALFCLLYCTVFGIKVVGKISICALVGSFVLTVGLFVRSITIPGAYVGYQFLFVPDLSRLFTFQVWWDSLQVVFYILSFSFWPIAVLASHNRFHNNSFLDSALLVMVPIFAPLLISITIFCFYGFLAHEIGSSVSEVATSGLEMMFVALPSAFSKLPASNVWCFAWFALLSLNLMRNLIGLYVAVVSSILDLFGWVHSWRQAVPVTLILGLFVFVSTVVGVYLGEHFWTALDVGFTFFSAVPLLVLCIALVWFYGGLQSISPLRFAKDVESMVGFFPGFFKFVYTGMWGIGIPLITGIFTLFKWREEVHFMFWIHIPSVLLTMALSALVLIAGVVIGGLHELWKHSHINTYCTDYFYRASLPLPQWGPALDFHRNYAGYLPAGFTPQPYRMGQMLSPSSQIQQPEGNLDAQQNTSTTEEVDPEATLPASTPMLGLTLCSTETTL